MKLDLSLFDNSAEGLLMKIYPYLRYALIAGTVTLGGSYFFKDTRAAAGTGLAAGKLPAAEAGRQIEGKELVLSFLTRVREQKLLSPRYHDFLAAVIGLVQSGRIKLEHISLKEAGRDLSGRYFPPRDTLRVVIPENLANDPALRLYFESSLLHELYHGYQDFKEEKAPKGRMEVGSYLLVADYQFRNYPDRMSNSWVALDDWISSSQGYALHFNIPRRVAERLKEAGGDQAGRQLIIEEITDQYLSTLVFLYAHFSEPARQMEQSINRQIDQVISAGGGSYNATQLVTDAIDAYKGSGHDPIQFTQQGTAIDLQYSDPLIRFQAAMAIHLTSIWKRGDKARTQRYLDQYFILFKEHSVSPGSPLFKAINSDIAFDGIK